MADTIEATGEAAGDEKSERRARILAEAERVFFEEGYEGACIDDIIKRVGGSKRTIYNEFGSKEGLFAAMIAESVTKTSEEVILQLDLDKEKGVGVRQALVDYAVKVMTIVNAPRVVALYRTVIGEANRFPKLASAFYESGPGRTIVRFAALLQYYRDRSEIDVENCALAAEQFGGLIRDSVFFAVLLGLRPPMTSAEIAVRAKAAVDLFLSGVGGGPASEN
ncbi:MAG: TetR/AcrR family transcriptional regulator [Alphaproteobacteria bacterium]